MFYDRLKSACELRNIALNTVVKATLPSNGVVDNWKKGGSPRAEAVLKIAKYLNVSTDYLLGLSENPSSVSENARKLDNLESSLIDRLRHCEPGIRENVLKMAFAILPEMNTGVFSSPNDVKSHQKKQENPVFQKKIEGEAAAGTPITAVPEDDLVISVPEKYLDERYFIVRARGDSMINAGIHNGSCCVFNRDAAVDDGRIVLAQIEAKTDQPDSAIKRIYRHGSQVELRSENPRYEPLFYPASDIRVSGVLVEIL